MLLNKFGRTDSEQTPWPIYDPTVTDDLPADNAKLEPAYMNSLGTDRSR